MPISPDDIPHPDEKQAIHDAAATPAKRPKRWWRWPARLVVGGALVLVLLVVMLPTLIGTGVGTSWLEQQINAKIPGQVEVGDLKLAWIKGQQLREVKLTDPSGEAVVSLDEVSVPDLGLLSLLRGSKDFGTVVIQGGLVDIVQDADGVTNLDRALGTSLFAPSDAQPGGEADKTESVATNQPKAPEEPRPKTPAKQGEPIVPIDLSLEFALRELVVKMSGPSFEPVRMDVPEATLSANGPSQLGFTLDAAVAQGRDRGETKWVGTVRSLFDSQGQLALRDAEVDIEGYIDHLPLTALDRLSGGQERLANTIGPFLDAEVELKGKAAELNAMVNVTSQNLNLRQALSADTQRLTSAEASFATLTVTPEAWPYWIGDGSDQGTTLASAFDLVFRLDQLDAPRKGQSLDLANTRFGAAVRLADEQQIVVEVPEQGEVVVSNLAALANSPSADREVSFALTADVDAYGKQGPFAGVVKLQRGETGWAAMEIEGLLRSLPMPVLDALLGQGQRLATTFGDSVGLSVFAQADGVGGYALLADFDQAVANAAAPRLIGTMAGGYAADGTIQLTTKDSLELTVTPEAFEQWVRPVAEVADVEGSAGLSLTEPSTVAAALDLSFALGHGPGLNFDPQRTRAEVTLELPEAQLVDEWYHRAFPVRNGKLVVDAPDLRQPVQITLECETGDSADDGELGRLSAEAEVTGLMLDDGYLQLERGQVTSVVELDEVPTVVFDTLTRQKGYAIAAFGQQMSVTVNLDGWSYSVSGQTADGQPSLGGGIDFELQSENGSVGALRGQDTAGFFVPEAPMTFHLNQTPALAGKIMRWVNPVLLPAVQSANIPLTITVDDDNFRLPTRDFSIDQLDADVQIQMGTVTISPDVPPVGQIITSLQQLGVLNEQLTYDAKVSPIELKIRNGVLGYEKLTFKIDDVLIEFGGNISMVDQTLDMNMTLAGREIERDPIIKQLVGDGLSIGGSVSEPDIDVSSLVRNVIPDRLPSLEELLGGFIKSTQEGGPPEEASEDEAAGDDGQPEAEPRTPSEELGSLLGDLLNRELRKSQEKRQREQERQQAEEPQPDQE